jgi:hypothetical protein
MGYENLKFKTDGRSSPEPKAWFVNLTLKSGNKKVGSVPVSTSSKETCPNTCPLKANGSCYADGGPLAIFWKKVTEQKAGASYDRFLTSVADLPDGQFWRHNQAGDLKPSDNNDDDIDAPALVKLVEANRGKAGFTYTHYDVIDSPLNNYAVTVANRNGFTVNLSGNNVAHADRLVKADCGPVVSVLPIEYERTTKKTEAGKVWAETLPEYKDRLATLPTTTPDGHRLVVCPATFADDVSCANCKLCQKVNRKTIVGFPAHGRSKRKADAIAQGAAS